MGTLRLRLPDALHEHLRQLAAREGVSMQQIVAAAVAEKVAREGARGAPGARAAFEAALARIPDVEPDARDSLPPLPEREVGRRWFLFVRGAGGPGIWLAGAGVIRLPAGRMLEMVVGRCSFCGKRLGEVRGLAGSVEKPPRICDECLEITVQILAEVADGHAAAERPAMPEPNVDGLVETFRQFASFTAQPDQVVQVAAAIRRQLNGTSLEPPAVRCSFCGARQHETHKLIAGTGVYICDVCVYDGAALFMRVLSA